MKDKKNNDDFFGSLGKAVTDFFKNLGHNISVYFKTRKLKKRVMDEKKAIIKSCRDIGKNMYKKRDQVDLEKWPELESYFNDIASSEESISSLEQKIEDIKNNKPVKAEPKKKKRKYEDLDEYDYEEPVQEMEEEIPTYEEPEVEEVYSYAEPQVLEEVPVVEEMPVEEEIPVVVKPQVKARPVYNSFNPVEKFGNFKKFEPEISYDEPLDYDLDDDDDTFDDEFNIEDLNSIDL